MEDLDPYRKWLGIPPADQPPDHYRLLGIGRFEDDPDTISNAADRQMTHLRTFQTGPHSALSQKLLNEIAAARLCLLDRAKKAGYDGELHARQAARSAQPVRQVPIAAPIQAGRPLSSLPLDEVGPPAQAARATQLTRHARPVRRSSAPMFAAGAAVLLAIVTAIALVARSDGESKVEESIADEIRTNRSEEKPSDAVTAVEPPTSQPRDAAASESSAPDVSTPVVIGPENSALPLPASPAAALAEAKPEIIEAQWGEGNRWQDITERVRSLVSNEQLLASASGSLFEGVPDPAYGTVKQVRIRYRAAGEPGELVIPNGELIYLDGRPAGGRKPSSEGLEVLEARYGAGATWLDGLPRVRRWVHSDRLSVRVRFTAPIDPVPNQGKALFLEYRTSDGEFFTHAWEGQELILDARPLATVGKPQDLIAAADPARQSAGGWRKDAGILVGPGASTDNLAIPTPFDDEYLLTAVFASAPRPFDVGITLPIGDRQVQLALAGWTGAISGLQNVAGAGANGNATTHSGKMFERGQLTLVRCTVRKSGLKVTCNGRVAVDWRGDRSRLLAPPEALASKPPAVVLRSQSNPWRVTRLEVAELGAEPAPPAPSGEVVDLLKRIDTEFDAVAGQWQKTGEGLLSPVGDSMRIGEPYSPPDDYESRVVAAAKSGNDAMDIGLLVGGRQTKAIIDGWAGALTGLHGLDGENADRNVTRRSGRVFVDERPKEFVCTVHPSSVRVTCDDKLLVDWHGDSRRFTLGCEVPDELGLFLGAWKTQFVVSKFELRPLPPESPEPPTNLSQPVDVLAQIDPKRDAVYGEWKMVDGALLAPGVPWARLQLPVLPPEEYTLRVDEVGGRDVAVGLVVGGRQVSLTLDGFGGEASGLGGDRNPTVHRGNVLRDDGPNAIVCKVRPDRVEVSCNGKGVIAWHGDPRTFSLPHDAMMPDDRRLFLRSWDKPFRVTRIELSAPAAAAPKKAPAGDKRRSLGDLLDDPAPDARREVTAAAPLAAADKKVADKFEPQWKAAKQLSDRVGVARKLYEAGLATTEDPVLRYGLLCEASRRAAGLGDAGIACDAIDQLGREFKIDALADKLAAASEALVKAHSPAQNWTLALVALLLCDRAMNEERYEEARKFAALAAAAGRRTRNHELKTYSERRLSGVRNRQQQQEQFEQAITWLKDEPDDAAANLAAGIDLCLFQGDWRRGLPRLARSGDVRLAEIAKLETEAGGAPARRAALVDAWMAEAEQQAGELRTECQLQARYWIDRGLPDDAFTPERQRVKTMLEKQFGLSAISQARLAPGLDMAMFEGGDFQQFRARRTDSQISHHFAFGSPDPKVPGDYFSIRWTGWLRPPLPGKYLIKTFSDDSIRVRINGKLIIDHWARGAGGEQVEVELTDQFQPIVVEYNEYEVGANVELSWALKGLSDFHVIPAEALFHDPAIEP